MIILGVRIEDQQGRVEVRVATTNASETPTPEEEFLATTIQEGIEYLMQMHTHYVQRERAMADYRYFSRARELSAHLSTAAR